MRAMTRYFRANPQVFILFMICLVLGLGTFIAVVIALAGSGASGTPDGGVAGAIAGASALLGRP